MATTGRTVKPLRTVSIPAPAWTGAVVGVVVRVVTGLGVCRHEPSPAVVALARQSRTAKLAHVMRVLLAK